MGIPVLFRGAGDGSHQIAPVGVASTNALGTVALNGQIGATGVPSAEALGTVGLNGTIAAVGIGSSEATGAPEVRAQLSAAGVASGEAVGSVALNGSIAAAGVSSAEASGTAALNGTIAPAALASQAEVGRPSVTPPVVESMHPFDRRRVMEIAIAAARLERLPWPKLESPLRPRKKKRRNKRLDPAPAVPASRALPSEALRRRAAIAMLLSE